MANIYDRALLAKIEVTKGTDPVPTAAADSVRNVSFKIKKSTSILERAIQKRTMGQLDHQVGKETMSIEITCELRGSGAAGTAPEQSPLILACRHAETIVASTSVAYKPSSAQASEKACTIYAYDDGLLWKFIGAVGDMKMGGTIDGKVLVTYSMSAAYLAPTVVSVVSGQVFDSPQPVIMSSATVFNDGSAIKVGKFDFACGNDVQNHYVTGENSFVVANRNPSLSFSKDSVNTVAEWTALTSATSVSFSATFGATAGNIVQLTAPNAKRKDVSYGERAERILHDVSYGLYESTSDDQYSIIFT